MVKTDSVGVHGKILLTILVLEPVKLGGIWSVEMFYVS